MEKTMTKKRKTSGGRVSAREEVSAAEEAPIGTASSEEDRQDEGPNNEPPPTELSGRPVGAAHNPAYDTFAYRWGGLIVGLILGGFIALAMLLQVVVN
jgi:hypothetical protein